MWQIMSLDWLIAILHLPFFAISSAFLLKLGTYMQVETRLTVRPKLPIKQHITTTRIGIYLEFRKDLPICIPFLQESIF